MKKKSVQILTKEKNSDRPCSSEFLIASDISLATTNFYIQIYLLYRSAFLKAHGIRCILMKSKNEDLHYKVLGVLKGKK